MVADAVTPGANLLSIMDNLTEKLNHPLSLRYTPYTVKAILISTILYGLGVGIYYANQRNYRRGEEHGSYPSPDNCFSKIPNT